MEFVKYEKDTMRIPIKSWCKDIDDGAMEQANNLSNHPALFKHVALMPDTHFGMGVPIGSVIACENAIIPNSVGSDAGCGMSFIQTDIPISILEETKDKQNRTLVKCILDSARRVIPVGFAKHKQPQEWSGFDYAPEIDIVLENIENAKFSLGTLGSGNHYIEIQKDSKNNLCFMLHSGSRNLGYKIGNHYHNLATELNEKYYSKVKRELKLSFLPLDSDEGQEYLLAMNYALEFAHQNRYVMMERFKSLTFNLIDKHFGHVSKNILMEVNAHHNYAAIENHFGKNVMVHRKGAIRARVGDIGIIPGSMETPSYIVKGLGNPDSFNSASHGAGRLMSRTKARETFNVEEMVNRLKDKGIILSSPNVSNTIDECGFAYKDIDEVLMAEADLVEPIERVTQIGVIKG